MLRTSPSGSARHLPAAVGLARAAIGIAHMIAPTRANELLAGPDAALATTRAAARTFGVREIYIGGGLFAATRHAPAAVRTLLRAGVVVDVWDTAAFAGTAHLPTRTRAAGCIIAGGFAVAGVLAEMQLDR
ncbi:hypothetical protein HQ325_04455 [Rhodococcus sp. BP-349]|uniref:hypothetical protein n=1 Tax=unclassified Rhodococcus (in: high G+C Gram-positive bacteria) TaxID=192944 RepID=UPI001C9B81B0|nr:MULTISPECIES: hypothetical protein [unclassified Rhodococcus (in: high G+C Gram-positive bacteria)]MBY6537917.1 hypothetical protein [Rhodococcus sp. BP-363]MBY6542254.1 hypothetical protein [Rhodococcus sp. BP-369]MBY6561484.1 hypothetical protein [Rhodococcus sp. BP-370]MBY6575776.1 hypothetical protein [Rhodococcus sp. BP-364]MBY6585077.1 hypothetical protein [Rhodococcus sp. BP-358]